MKTESAIIESVWMGWEDHGLYTFFVFLNYGGSSQGFGGYALGNSSQLEKIERYKKVVMDRTCFAVGVDKWEDLPGHRVIAMIENGLIRGIAGEQTQNWFFPAELFKRMESEDGTGV